MQLVLDRIYEHELQSPQLRGRLTRPHGTGDQRCSPASHRLMMTSARDLPLLQRLCEGDPIAPAEFCERYLSGLVAGQAIVSLTGMTCPLLVAVKPTPARVRMVE